MLFVAYTLLIDSDLDLPELMPASHCGDRPPDVRIRLGCPDEPLLQQLSPNVWTDQHRLLLQIADVASLLIEEGRQITVCPFPGVDPDLLRVYVLGSAMGFLLFQRGHLVLHGNAIRIGDACMVCVGRSGAGKSTLAAGFIQRGFAALADDVVPIDAQFRALPGFPRIKLWQDSAAQLGINTDGLSRIRPDLEKFNIPLGERFADRPLPVRWIYVIEPDPAPGVSSESMPGLWRLPHLLEHTYRIEFMSSLALQANHLQLCGQLAGRVHFKRVRRPANGFLLDALIDHLLADMTTYA